MSQLITDTANECMDFYNYCSGTAGTVTARKTGGLNIDRKSKKKTKEQVWEWV